MIEIGGATPGAPAWLLVNAFGDNCAGPDPMIALSNRCFPDYVVPVLSLMVPIDAEGCGSVPLYLPGIPGLHLTAQALSVTAAGNAILGTPVVIDV